MLSSKLPYKDAVGKLSAKQICDGNTQIPQARKS